MLPLYRLNDCKVGFIFWYEQSVHLEDALILFWQQSGQNWRNWGHFTEIHIKIKTQRGYKRKSKPNENLWSQVYNWQYIAIISHSIFFGVQDCYCYSINICNLQYKNWLMSHSQKKLHLSWDWLDIKQNGQGLKTVAKKNILGNLWFVIVYLVLPGS